MGTPKNCKQIVSKKLTIPKKGQKTSKTIFKQFVNKFVLIKIVNSSIVCLKIFFLPTEMSFISPPTGKWYKKQRQKS